MKILHVADTHLGLRQYGLETRRRDMAAAFERVVDVAVQSDVVALIHAGDVLDTRTPTTDDLRDVFTQLTRLREAGIPFLGVVGNHEGKRGHQWIDLFAQLRLAVHLNSETPYDLRGVPVRGVDYLSRRPEEVAPPRVDGGILVMHQLLDQSAPHGELALQQLFECGARLVLLGDDHHHNVWRDGDTMVTYSGSTERCSSGEAASRGFSIINLNTLALERRELKTRRFCYLGSREHPLKDPLAEMEAQDHRLKDAVVVLHLGEQPHTPRKLKEEGERRGALHVIARRVEGATPDGGLRGLCPTAIEQLSSGRHLQRAIDRAVGERPFSQLVRQVDELVRDADVPDSRVDERVTEALENAGM